MTTRSTRAHIAWLVLLGASLAALVAISLVLWARSLVDVTSIGDRPKDQAPLPASSAEVVPIPVQIDIPSLRVATGVLPVGLDAAQAVDIPTDITKVGWYELGVPPGASRGSAVIVGHRDGKEQGHGVFYDLGRLSPGDQISVVNSAQKTLTYRVVARQFISKKRLPVQELFAVTGPPRLTLISCGGYYDRDNGGYQDNVVVTAVKAK